MATIYEPQEDSYLLKKYVEKYAKGIVLDIGTGSGIQAQAAEKKADFIVATDIAPEALRHCNSVLKSDKILCLNSDLFSFFEKKFIIIKDKLFKGFKDRKDEFNEFDTIIFNPPYLHLDEKDKDISLDGGEKGYELIERFLSEAGKYLANDGIILMVFSSLTGKEKVDESIAKNNFKFEELEKLHIFFENIYCYKIFNTSEKFMR